MTLIAEFTVPDDPISKGRPQHGNGKTYTPQRTKDAETIVKTYARQAMKGRDPVGGPVSLEAHFHMKTRRRGDIDNKIKLLADSMNMICYLDDDQIVHVQAWKHYSLAEPCTCVRVFSLDH